MIVHVKKNSQRATYTKQNHIECIMINSNGIESKVNCSKFHQASLNEDTLLSQYLTQREEECRRYLFGGL